MSERKAFKDLPDEDNARAYDVGMAIYQAMVKKYPVKDDKSADLILNSLCMALIMFMKMHVEEDNRKYIIQIVHKILIRNL